MDKKDRYRLFHRAVHLHKNEQLDQAIEIYQQLNTDNEKNVSILQNYIVALWQKKQHQKCINIYYEHEQLCQNNTQILNTIGLCYAELKDYIKAIFLGYRRRKSATWINCGLKNNVEWREMMMLMNWVL